MSQPGLIELLNELLAPPRPNRTAADVAELAQALRVLFNDRGLPASGRTMLLGPETLGIVASLDTVQVPAEGSGPAGSLEGFDLVLVPNITGIVVEVR